MHPCTRAQLSDSFHGWEVRASAQPTNAPGTNRATLTTAPAGRSGARSPRRKPRPGQPDTHHTSMITTPGATPPTLERTRHLPANTFREVASGVGGWGMQKLTNQNRYSSRNHSDTTRTQGLTKNGHHTSAALRALLRISYGCSTLQKITDQTDDLKE